VDDGRLRFSFGSYGESNGQFNGPTGVAVDRAGNILVADWGNARVQVLCVVAVVIVSFLRKNSAENCTGNGAEMLAKSALRFCSIFTAAERIQPIIVS